MIKFYAKSDGKSIMEHTEDLFKKLKDFKSFLYKNNFEYILSEEDIKILKYAIFAHDLGKINYKFQKRIYKLVGDEDVQKLDEFFENIKDVDIRHEILSVIWAILLYKNELKDDDLSIVLSLILLHHYNEYYLRVQEDLYFLDIVNEYGDEIKNYYEFILKNKDFNNYLKDIKEQLKEKFDIKIEIKKIKFEDLLEVKISSKYLLDPKDNGNFNKNFVRFIKLLGILRRCDYSSSGNFDIETPLDVSYFEIYNEFNIKKNWWQDKIINEIDLDKDILLIAPTGSGKTEFSLLFLKKLNKKLMYSLPLRVALNDLYEKRFPKYFGKKYINVLHSTNYIEYLNEQNPNVDEIYKMLEESSMLSFPINLTTPDQIFLVSLKYYGYDKIACLFPYSFVVVDEIQMYNEEMLAVLISSLKMIKDFGGRILVMSATVPGFVKNVLKEQGIIDEIIDVSDERYKEYNIKNLDTKRHVIKLIDKQIFNVSKNIKVNKESYSEILKIIDNNKDTNILIILNNVKKAIELYKKLEKEKSKIGKNIDLDLCLLHSRLLEKEKTDRVEKIKESKNGKIVISTQLVEASVDIDFDILITEISTIDSQIQRWGRIWRNRNNYTKDKPNIFIFTGIDNRTTRIYSRKVIEKTIKVLKNYEGKTLDYKEEKKMVDEVFSDSEIQKIYEGKIKENLEYLKYFTAEKKSEAQKIFRRLASVSLVFKQELDENIKEHITFENRNKSWKELEELIGLNKLEIKKKFVENSISIPIYLFEKIYSTLKIFEFKGFYIVDNLDQNILEKIRIYGFDAVIDELKVKLDDDEDVF